MPQPDTHLDRPRAESFGAVAERYDRLRPCYPEALFDNLGALEPAAILDIGCGTGKATEPWIRRGLPVLGLEPDERMASLARDRGIPVEIGTFEAWDDAGRTFDLITCANAWHWIHPDIGLPKIGRLLRPGGRFAMFWAVDVLDQAVLSALEPAYRKHSPGTRMYGSPPPPIADEPPPGFDRFASLAYRYYPVERVLTAEQWTTLLSTVSDHQRLEPERREALLSAAGEILESLGGTVRSRCGSRLWLAGAS